MGLEAVELVIAVEQEFGIVIPDALAAKMITPAHLIAHVQDAVSVRSDRKACISHDIAEKREERRWTNEEVRHVVRRIISEQLGIEKFEDTDEFVRDLGID